MGVIPESSVSRRTNASAATQLDAAKQPLGCRIAPAAYQRLQPWVVDTILPDSPYYT
jgi:hypothetical protein